jgi:hypothetical protein
MSRRCAILDRGWTFADRHCVADPAVVARLLRVMAGTPHDPGTPQMVQRFLLQGTTGLDEETAVDGLV